MVATGNPSFLSHPFVFFNFALFLLFCSTKLVQNLKSQHMRRIDRAFGVFILVFLDAALYLHWWSFSKTSTTFAILWNTYHLVDLDVRFYYISFLIFLRVIYSSNKNEILSYYTLFSIILVLLSCHGSHVLILTIPFWTVCAFYFSCPSDDKLWNMHSCTNLKKQWYNLCNRWNVSNNYI